jgi:hypothetical protein
MKIYVQHSTILRKFLGKSSANRQSGGAKAGPPQVGMALAELVGKPGLGTLFERVQEPVRTADITHILVNDRGGKNGPCAEELVDADHHVGVEVLGLPRQKMMVPSELEIPEGSAWKHSSATPKAACVFRDQAQSACHQKPENKVPHLAIAADCCA